jgi:hypothetical protein
VFSGTVKFQHVQNNNQIIFGLQINYKVSFGILRGFSRFKSGDYEGQKVTRVPTFLNQF